MANEIKEIDQFYEELQTLPRLVSDLALSVAEAQRRLDENYIESLTKYTQIVQSLSATSNDFRDVLKSIAPSRYQFTETTVEVRADLQMASATDLKVDAGLGVKTTMLAVTVNASYAKRSAYDYQAAALVRTVLHAIPANDAALDKLLTAAGKQAAELPTADRFKGISDALKGLSLAAAPEK